MREETGSVLSEGAAVLVLEDESTHLTEGAEILADRIRVSEMPLTR